MDMTGQIRQVWVLDRAYLKQMDILPQEGLRTVSPRSSMIEEATHPRSEWTLEVRAQCQATNRNLAQIECHPPL